MSERISREWRVALALALAIKLCSLLALYAGWKWVDGPRYQGDIWMTRPGTGFLDNLANFDGAWFVRVGALGYRRLAEGDYDCAAETRRLRVLDPIGCEQGRWPSEPGSGRFDRGYGYRHYPLFPWLIAGADALGLDPARAGVVMANVFSLAYGVLLYFLARRDLGMGGAALAVAFSQLHPGAFALSAGYNEPLFLMLAAGAMLGARSGKWPAAGALAMLAAMTRIFGTLLFVPLFWEWLTQRAEAETGGADFARILSIEGVRRGLRGLWSAPAVWWLALIPAGTLAVLANYDAAAGDAFIWMKVHEANVYGHVNWPWLMMLETWRKGWVIAGKELPLHALLLLTLALSFRRVRGAYWVWMLIFFLHHTTNGNHSYLRYQLECLPLFVALAALCRPVDWLWPAALALSAGLFVFFGAMFINGYWVA